MKTIQNRFARRGNSKLRVRNVSLNGEGRRNSATLETRGEFINSPKCFAVRKRHLGVINPRLREIPDDKFPIHSTTGPSFLLFIYATVNCIFIVSGTRPVDTPANWLIAKTNVSMRGARGPFIPVQVSS